MPATRRLAAILHVDVVGYSRLMEADDEGAHERFVTYLGELNDKIREHQGRNVRFAGDGLVAEFPSVVDAVRCAVEIQREIAERNAAVPVERRIEFRLGINVGDIIEDGDIFGDGVNIAARLAAISEPGGVYISEDAFRQVHGNVGTHFVDLGEQRLRNVARPLRVYRADLAGAAQPPATKPLGLSISELLDARIGATVRTTLSREASSVVPRAALQAEEQPPQAEAVRAPRRGWWTRDFGPRAARQAEEQPPQAEAVPQVEEAARLAEERQRAEAARLAEEERQLEVVKEAELVLPQLDPARFSMLGFRVPRSRVLRSPIWFFATLGLVAYLFRHEIVALISAITEFFRAKTSSLPRGHEVTTALAVTVGPPGSLSAENVPPPLDLVDVSAFAPDGGPAGSEVLVQVFLHRLGDAAIAKEWARAADHDAIRRGIATLVAAAVKFISVTGFARPAVG
jgi:class 3 adenylate cyclase